MILSHLSIILNEKDSIDSYRFNRTSDLALSLLRNFNLKNYLGLIKMFNHQRLISKF